MNNEKHTNVYDAGWKEIYDQSGRRESADNTVGGFEPHGQIRFRKNKRRSTIRGFIKSIALLLAASVSGAVAGVYVTEKKYSNSGEVNYTDSFYITPGIIEHAGDTVVQENTITRVAEFVAPSVVGISSSAKSSIGRPAKQTSGSGIIISENGLIVTNYHVIENADKISVRLSGANKPISADLVNFDKISDLAVIKIEAQGLPVAKFGDSSKVRIGEIAIAIGNPLGEEFAGTVTQGIISATNRRIEILDPFTKEKTIYKVLQTDAAINPGNSGGPLCNAYGEVIGINSLRIGSRDDAQGMGFAITSNEALKVIESILNYGKVTRPDLGVDGFAYPYTDVTGVYVRGVYLGAAEAGIRSTDIVLGIDGNKVAKPEDIAEIIEKYKVGDTVICSILRNDEIIDFKVILKEN